MVRGLGRAIPLVLVAAFLALVTGTGYASPGALQSYSITSIPITPQGIPAGLAADPTSGSVYVANFAGGEVRALDGNTLTTLWSKPVGSKPLAVTVNTSNGDVWVTAAGDNSVSILRGSDGAEIAQVPVGGFPNGIAINPNTHKVYVSNRDSDNLTVIDETTKTVLVSSVPVGQEPMGVAVNPSTNRIYVPTRRDNSVTVLDGSTDSPVRTIGLGTEPGGAAVDPGLNKVYVGSSKGTGVFVIDGSTDLIREIIWTWRWPESVAVDANTHRVYASVLALGSVAVIDGNTNSLVTYLNTAVRGYLLGIAVNGNTGRIYTATFDQGVVTGFDPSGSTFAQASSPHSGPRDIALDPQTGRAYVTRTGDDSVVVIDENTDSIVGPPIHVGPRPGYIVANPASQKVYVSNRDNTVSVISQTSNSVIATVALPSEPGWAAVDSAANRLYLTLGAGFGPSSVAIIDGTTDTALSNFALGPCPCGIALDPAPVNHLYVTDVCQDLVYVLDLANLPAVLATIPVGKYPAFIDVNPTTHLVYVANSDDDTVTVIDGASSIPLGTLSLPGARPLDIAINPTTGIIYVSDGGGLYRGVGLYSIDGATNAISHAAFGGNGSLAVDPSLNRVYMADVTTATVFDLKPSPPTTTPAGTDVQVALGSNVTATFASVTASGDTALTISDTAPTMPRGFRVGTPAIYYDISSTATISCPCTVILPYDPVQTPNPKMYHLEGGVWVDVTTSVDTTSGTVTGVVSALSFFTVGQPIVPPAVGGIVELRRDTSAPAGQQPGSAAPPYAALAGAAAAGALALTAGAWYARRRWLQVGR